MNAASPSRPRPSEAGLGGTPDESRRLPQWAYVLPDERNEPMSQEAPDTAPTAPAEPTDTPEALQGSQGAGPASPADWRPPNGGRPSRSAST